jgi:hypothetical protein
VIAQSTIAPLYAVSSGLQHSRTRYVLTVGHNLFPRDGPLARSRPVQVQVMPGRNGSTSVLGTFNVSDFRIHPNWERSTDMRFDYALMRLEEPIGRRKFMALNGGALGWWGSAELGHQTSRAPVRDSLLLRRLVYVCGYPQEPAAWKHRQVMASDVAEDVRTRPGAAAEFRSSLASRQTRLSGKAEHLCGSKPTRACSCSLRSCMELVLTTTYSSPVSRADAQDTTLVSELLPMLTPRSMTGSRSGRIRKFLALWAEPYCKAVRRVSTHLRHSEA